MVACNVCRNNVISPVCLPCGHIFCSDCISGTIRAIAPFTTMHHCPSCQTSYSTAALNPAAVPPQLRIHLLPSIRKLQLSSELSAAAPTAPVPSGSDLQTENARLRAENAALQKNCAMWRKRAEAHSSSTLGLLQLMRMTRDQAMQLARQRNELRRKCEIMQRRLYGDDDDADTQHSADDDENEDRENILDVEEPFLPSTLLNQVDMQRARPSPISLSSSPNLLGLTSLKRVRTPYDSRCNSDAEEDERVHKRPNRASAPMSPLPGI